LGEFRKWEGKGQASGRRSFFGMQFSIRRRDEWEGMIIFDY